MSRNVYQNILSVVFLVSLLTTLGGVALPAVASAESNVVSIAGWVNVDVDVAPYIVIRVLSGASGVVVRSASLDSTRTFSFSGLPESVQEVQAVVELPQRLYHLDSTASKLSASLKEAISDSDSPIELRVVAVKVSSAKEAVQVSNSLLGPVVSGVMALTALCTAWFGRHFIVTILERSTIKPPKQRRVVQTY